MKPSVVPTAPGLRSHRPPRRIGWLVLTVTLSLAAGSTGAVFTLSLPSQSSSIERWLKLSSSDVVVIPPAEDTATATLVSTIQARQFDAVVVVAVNGQDRGVGVILSNDGWLVTPSATLIDATAVTVTLASGKSVESDRVLADAYSGVTFIHLPKTNLPIVDLRTQPAALGDAVVVLQPAADRRASVRVTHLAAVAEPLADVFSTSQNNLAYLSDRSLTGVTPGAPVFDYHAQVLGIIIDDQTILPMAALTGRLQHLLDRQAITPVALNLTYTLSAAGAKIVTTNSNEFALDDVITEVGGQAINNSNDLSWALQDQLQSSFSVKLTRAGEKKTIELSID